MLHSVVLVMLRCTMAQMVMPPTACGHGCDRGRGTFRHNPALPPLHHSKHHIGSIGVRLGPLPKVMLLQWQHEV